MVANYFFSTIVIDNSQIYSINIISKILYIEFQFNFVILLTVHSLFVLKALNNSNGSHQ